MTAFLWDLLRAARDVSFILVAFVAVFACVMDIGDRWVKRASE